MSTWNGTRRGSFHAVTALGIAASAVGPRAALAVPSIDGASVVRGTGHVKTEATGEWREVAAAGVIKPSMTVQASDAEPLEMLLPDGVTVVFGPAALAEMLPATKLPSEASRWTRGYHIVLDQGEVEVRMPPGKKGARAFLVSTKAGTLTEWRGQMHVTVQNDATAAAIYEGALVVGSNGQGFPVYDGAGILMRRNVNPDKTRAIPPPPTWGSRSGAFSVPLGANAPTELAWQGVPSAASYRIEIATDPAMGQVIERASLTTPHYRATKLTSTARYWARLRTVSDVGIVGPWSGAEPIHILRLALPDGAFIANDGVVVLPDGANIPMTEPEHLDVAYENATSLVPRASVPLYWAGLSGPLRPSDEAPLRVIHLRDRDIDSAQVQIVLAHRELRAHVSLGPARARWPGDPVEARIEVADPSRRIDVASAGITIQTMLDLTPLSSVKWQHAGTMWAARIAPRLIGDPSVLRVLVRDGRGTEIGRGFLELEPAPQEPDDHGHSGPYQSAGDASQSGQTSAPPSR